MTGIAARPAIATECRYRARGVAAMGAGDAGTPRATGAAHAADTALSASTAVADQPSAVAA
ncbi:hypothetical protein OSJ80_24975, partial [Mycobacterium ulcerans]